MQLLPIAYIWWKDTETPQEPKIKCCATDDKCEAEYGIYFIMTTFYV